MGRRQWIFGARMMKQQQLFGCGRIDERQLVVGLESKRYAIQIIHHVLDSDGNIGARVRRIERHPEIDSVIDSAIFEIAEGVARNETTHARNDQGQLFVRTERRFDDGVVVFVDDRIVQILTAFSIRDWARVYPLQHLDENHGILLNVVGTVVPFENVDIEAFVQIAFVVMLFPRSFWKIRSSVVVPFHLFLVDTLTETADR